MKKNIFVYGIIAGVIICTNMVITVGMMYDDPNFKGSEVLGYTTMVVVFSLIFFGVRSYRNKEQNGYISFGKAFKMGALIALLSSTMYVLTWIVFYHFYVPDFMEKYVAHVLKTMADSGASTTEIAAKTTEMNTFSENYKNPLFLIAMTYMEILPVGLVVSLISALVLKRKVTEDKTK